MTGAQVVAFLALVQSIGIEVWVDGGWGVDAPVGRQTRDHSDLDLVVASDSLPALQSLLEEHGFAVTRNWLPTAIAFRHLDGREVDLHPIEPTPDGGGDQIQLNGVRHWHYERPVMATITGVDVLCCSVSTQLRAHVGYEPDEHDYADISVLHKEFGVALPAPYDRGA